MDIIAYGAASQEKRRAKELADSLGPDVEGTNDTLEQRLDLLMDSMDDVTRLADRVIVRDAVNLMKAEARLNTLIQAKKYGMEHMFFDDLLDLSGIDTVKSTGYVHDAVKGNLSGNGARIELKEVLQQPKSFIVVANTKRKTGKVGLIPQMMSDSQDGYKASASTVYWNEAPYKASSAMDRSTLTSWASHQNNNMALNNEWLKLEMPQVNTFDSYSIKVDSNVGWGPKSFKLEISQDNIVWQTVDQKSGVVYSANEVKSFALSEPRSCRYVRLSISEAVVQSMTMINEFQIYREQEVEENAIFEYRVPTKEWVQGDIEKMIFLAEDSLGDVEVRFVLNENQSLEWYGLIWT